jgi:hypothetical protein
LGEVDYLRPCVVVEVTPAVLCVAAISAQVDLYLPGQHFLIPSDHPDFSNTGLDRTSYVIGAPLFDAKIEEVERVLGCLNGELAGSFEKWIG